MSALLVIWEIYGVLIVDLFILFNLFTLKKIVSVLPDKVPHNIKCNTINYPCRERMCETFVLLLTEVVLTVRFMVFKFDKI